MQKHNQGGKAGMGRTLRQKLSQSVEVLLSREVKQWVSKVTLHGVSRSDAVALLQGLVAELQAEVEGEAMRAMRRERDVPERQVTQVRRAA